jgi:hypothetical protein
MELDHDRLKADLEAAQNRLGVRIERHDNRSVDAEGHTHRERTLEIRLPRASSVCARFAREGWVERVKKLFGHEVEVGVSWFDDLVYVMTSTPTATAALLAHPRVQQALVLLVDPTRHVSIERDVVRVVDVEASDDGRDASAELLALVAHLL